MMAIVSIVAPPTVSAFIVYSHAARRAVLKMPCHILVSLPVATGDAGDVM